MFRGTRNDEVANGRTAGEGVTFADTTGATRPRLDCDVVAPCGHSKAQNSFAAATSGSAVLIRAVSQQFAIPCIPHSLSPKCSGIPAKALLARISTRNSDATRVFMVQILYGKC